MILVTRLNGAAFALNPDLIERADSTPDTVVTLVDGTKYVIAESVPDFIELVRQYRASVIAEAHRQVDEPADPRRGGAQRTDGTGTQSSAGHRPRAIGDEHETAAKVVPLHPRER
ncbi:MAG TPA: flagellar FlbD family protein [Rugosimonospora sp.]|nr:flagellar FlbD family protein [Rugosimonospora sp.]